MRALPGKASRQPPGPEPVSRAASADDQRRRILEATADLVAEQGYAETTIEQIVRRARVGYATFYKHYADKQEAFLALMDAAVERTAYVVEEAFDREDGPWPDKVGAGLGALLKIAAAHPGVARACLVEAPTAGPEAAARHEAALKRFAPLLRPGRELNPRADKLPDEPRGDPGRRSALGDQPAPDRRRSREAAGAPARGARVPAAALRRRGRRGARGRRRGRGLGLSGAATMADEETLGPLPAGRHGFSREQVAHNQRERLIAGLATAVAEKGYRAVTITDITKEARVSRRVFYENFEGKEECFLAAFEVVVGHIRELAAEAVAAIDDWPQRAIAAARAVLAFFADEPDLARLCLVESQAAGPAVSARFHEAVHEVVPLPGAGPRRARERSRAAADHRGVDHRRPGHARLPQGRRGRSRSSSRTFSPSSPNSSSPRTWARPKQPTSPKKRNRCRECRRPAERRAVFEIREDRRTPDPQVSRRDCSSQG